MHPYEPENRPRDIYIITDFPRLHLFIAILAVFSPCICHVRKGVGEPSTCLCVRFLYVHYIARRTLSHKDGTPAGDKTAGVLSFA